MFAGPGKRLKGVWKVDLTECFQPRGGVEGIRKESGQDDSVQVLKRLVNEPAEHSRAETLRGSMNGNDALQVNGTGIVVFEDFEFGLFENELAAAAFWFAINDEARTGGDDFFNPEQVVPADGDTTGESVALFLV